MKTIAVIRHQHNGMTGDINGSKRFELGKVGSRNLIKAFRLSGEVTGSEGYGAPYYTHEIHVAGVALEDTDETRDLERAICDPWILTSRHEGFWMDELGGKTTTELADAVLATVAASAAFH